MTRPRSGSPEPGAALGIWLRRGRQECGLSAAEAGRRLGYSRKQISAVELGTIQGSGRMLVSYLDLLLSVDQLSLATRMALKERRQAFGGSALREDPVGYPQPAPNEAWRAAIRTLVDEGLVVSEDALTKLQQTLARHRREASPLDRAWLQPIERKVAALSRSLHALRDWSRQDKKISSE